MAITFEIPVGVPTTLTQNQVYALPATTIQMLATVAVEVSVDNSTWVALTGSATASGAVTSAVFTRCTTSNSIVICERIN
jgi:predicted benzoate:H+ symporter BenE